MPIIQPRKEQKFVTHKIKIDEDISNEVMQYMKAFNLGDDLDNFFETAAKQVLDKDKDYQKYLKELKKKASESQLSTAPSMTSPHSSEAVEMA